MIRIIKESRGGKTSFQKTWFILWPFLLYMIVQDLAQLLFTFLLNESLRCFGEGFHQFMIFHASSVRYVIIGISLLVGIGAVFPIARKEINKVKLLNLDKCIKSPFPYLLLAVFAASVSIFLNLLFSLSGIIKLSRNYEEVSMNQYGAPIIVGTVLYGFLTPFVEEAVFRGIVYNRMRTYYTKYIAMVVSSLLFGLYHGNLVQGLYGTILGFFIVYSYERYKSFFAPLLFHGMANISIYLLSYDASFFRGLITWMNCVIFLVISVLIGICIHKKLTIIENKEN